MTSISVLVVDDDPGVRQLLATALSGAGLTPYLAGSAAEAILQFLRHRDAIDVVLLDVQMGDLGGPPALLALRTINPTVRCCFMSGYAGSYSEADLLACGAARLFPKPFSSLQLLVDELKKVAAGGREVQTSPPYRESPVDDGACGPVRSKTGQPLFIPRHWTVP